MPRAHFASLVILFLSAGAAYCADNVFLKSGVEVDGTVTEENDNAVVIKLSSGDLRSYRRADVEAVVYDPRAHLATNPETEAKPAAKPTPKAPPEGVKKPAEQEVPAESPAKKPGSVVWMESMEKAVAAAKDANKYILVDFTGSDWCGWCEKLDDQVFSTKDFEEWSNTNVVLLKLDFPRFTAQNAAIKSQNAELMKKYNITGYPTVLILNAEGEEMGRQVGYDEKPDKWIAAMTAIVNKK